MQGDEKEFGITSTTLETLASRSDVIILCVRPFQAEEILQKIGQMGLKNKLLISILAGARISYFERFLSSFPIIRAMPNVASEVGEGMTILSPNVHATPEFKSLANLLFLSMGSTVELSEELMDIATGIAGSGPAYAFTLMEAVARLGEQEGIPYEKSLKMAAQMFLGSAKILLKGGVVVDELIRQIAVPNGTTEAGLKVMKELGIAKQLQDVFSVAASRSKAISQEIR